MFFGGGGRTDSQGATQLSSGEQFTDAYTALFASPTKLAGYDMLVLGCEGSQLSDAKDPYEANIKAYADGGGRILAEHFQATWIRRGPTPWPATADWIGVGPDLPTPTTGTIDSSGTKGMALLAWMKGIGATTNGQLSVSSAQNSVASVVAPTQRWLIVPTPSGTGPSGTVPVLLSFPTPFESTSGPQCGRVDFTDTHMPGPDRSQPQLPFPDGCMATTTTPQERLLEFLFFDAPTCVPNTP
jgi:hypothetical protein